MSKSRKCKGIAGSKTVEMCLLLNFRQIRNDNAKNILFNNIFGYVKLKTIILSLRTANFNSRNFITAAGKLPKHLSLFFNLVLRQAVLTASQLNLCMWQHTYRQGTAELLWRLVGGYWIVFMLWLAVGTDRYRVASELHINST